MDIKDSLILFSAGNLYWKDIHGIYEGCNWAFANLLGLHHPAEIKGKTDADLFADKKMAEAIFANDKKVISEAQEIIIEEKGIDRYGNLAYYLSQKRPLKNDEGKTIGLLGTSIDITQQKQAETVKKQFIKNMEHDLRTPFGGIYSMVEMLRMMETHPEKAEMLGMVEESSKRLLALFNQVLELMRLEDQSLQFSEFGLHEVANEIKGLFQSAARAKNLEFVIDCPEVQVYTDKFAVNRILLNLVGNAIKFTDAGKVSVSLQADGHQLLITVQDTGRGIAPENHALIFEKFFKCPPSYKLPTFQGSGVGLYLVKYFTDLLNGTVSVNSQEGEGAIFKVTIPLASVGDNRLQVNG